MSRSRRARDHRRAAKQRRRIDAARRQARIEVLNQLYEHGARLEALDHRARAMWNGELTPARLNPAGINIEFKQVFYRWAINCQQARFDKQAIDYHRGEAVRQLAEFALANGFVGEHIIPSPDRQTIVGEYYINLGVERPAPRQQAAPFARS